MIVMGIFKLTLGPCLTDTYIIIEKGEAVVIDPASDAEIVIDYAKTHGAEIKHVLLTHGHFDHIGAVSQIQKQCRAKVYMSKTDYDKISELNSYFGETVDPFVLDVALKEGDELSLCGHDFMIIETPGHTPGGLCYITYGKTIFSGDTLFFGSIGRTDFPLGDHSALISSVKRLFALEGDYSVRPGHGGDTTLDRERKYNPYVD